MKTNIILTTLIFLLIILVGCSDSNNTRESSKLAYELSQRLWTDYSTDLKKGNPIEIEQNFNKDARILYPNSPEINGIENIHRTISEMFPNITIVEFNFDIEECFMCDSLLFNYITVNEKYKVDSVEYKSMARISSLWKLNSDKEWKMKLFHVNYRN